MLCKMLRITPRNSLFDSELSIRAHECAPDEKVHFLHFAQFSKYNFHNFQLLQITLVTRVEHITGNYISLANYHADKNGIVDTAKQPCVGGSFSGQCFKEIDVSNMFSSSTQFIF